MAERQACCSLPHRNQCICRVTRLFFYKTIKLKRQNTGEFILLFNLTAWKKQKNKQNPQWSLHPIPPPYVPPPFQKGKTKKERGYLPWGFAEPFAATTAGTAVYTDTLPVAEHQQLSSSSLQTVVRSAKKYHGPCKAPVTGTTGIEGTQLQI